MGAPPAAPACEQPAPRSPDAQHAGAGAEGTACRQGLPGATRGAGAPTGHTMLRWRRANASASERARSSDWAGAKPPCRPTLMAQARLQHSPAQPARASGPLCSASAAPAPAAQGTPRACAEQWGARHRWLTPIHLAVLAAPDQLVQLDAMARGRRQRAVVRRRHAARAPAGLHTHAAMTVTERGCGVRPARVTMQRRRSAPLQERTSAGAHRASRRPPRSSAARAPACGCSGDRQAPRPAPSAAGAWPGPGTGCAQLLHGTTLQLRRPLPVFSARLGGAAFGSTAARSAGSPLAFTRSGLQCAFRKQVVARQWRSSSCSALLRFWHPLARPAQAPVTSLTAARSGPHLRAPVCANAPA